MHSGKYVGRIEDVPIKNEGANFLGKKITVNFHLKFLD